MLINFVSLVSIFIKKKKVEKIIVESLVIGCLQVRINVINGKVNGDDRMITKQEVLDNYELLETSIDNRFGKRLVDFLTFEELSQIAKVNDEYKDKWVVEKEWTEENIVKQLVSDAEFGKEKAENERGISSALMTQVCEAWLFVLEDTDIPSDDWGYNLGFFERILKKYRGNLNV